MAEPTTSRKNVVKGRRLRGQALLAQGRLAEAEQELETALQVAQQVGNPCQLWRSQAVWSTVADAGGVGRSARRPGLHAGGMQRFACQAALAIADHVAAALAETPLPETFLRSAHVQTLRQRAGCP